MNSNEIQNIEIVWPNIKSHIKNSNYNYKMMVFPSGLGLYNFYNYVYNEQYVNSFQIYIFLNKMCNYKCQAL